MFPEPDPDPGFILEALVIILAGVFLAASLHYDPQAPVFDLGYDLLP